MIQGPPYLNHSAVKSGELEWKFLEAPGLKVAIHSGDAGHLNNVVFREDVVLNSGWCGAYVSLRKLCHEHNVEIATTDFVPMDQADVIVFINLPRERKTVELVAMHYPKARRVLIASESPAVQPHVCVPANHRLFDVVLTHKGPALAGRGHGKLPIGCGYVPAARVERPSFEKRRFCVMVNTNFNHRITRLPRPWNVLDGMRSIRSGGWHLPWSRFVQIRRNTQYHLRGEFVRAAEKLEIEDFDLFGGGWEPMTGGWYHRFFPERPYRHWRGPLIEDKFKVLGRYRFAFAYENFAGREGYVSEKIFDAFAAGTVPIYYGDERIDEIIPREAFVHRRDYRDDRALLADLLSWNQSRWSRMLEAGQDFLRSPGMNALLPGEFARSVLAVLKQGS